MSNTTTTEGTGFAPVQTASAPIRTLPDGEWVKLSDTPNAKVWRIGDYDRSERKYWLNDCSDLSHGKLVSGSRVVFYGFDY